MMSSMSSPEKKTTERPSLIHPETSQPTPIMSLPVDLLLSCFARVSRLYYPTLSLVSKTFRSLLASPELYRIRSSLGLTESCLYVCLNKSHLDTNPRWFTLCRKPDRTLNNDIIEKREKEKKPNSYVLAEIPRSPSQTAHWSGFVAIGSNIYNIGGPDDEASSSVSILDCTSNTWREAPSMRVKRKYSVANALDGKIYVAGGCKDCDSSNWMEVFDSKTQTWEFVSSPGAEICGLNVHKSAVVEGEIYLVGDKVLAYKPKEGRWRIIGSEINVGWVWYSFCVIEDVLYCYYKENFNWYDTNKRLWRKLNGVEGLPRVVCYGIGGRMVDYDGKMAIFWDKIVTSYGYKNQMICCAVIELERRNSEEIWGKILWEDAVLSVPMSYNLNVALAPIF